MVVIWNSYIVSGKNVITKEVVCSCDMKTFISIKNEINVTDDVVIWNFCIK